MDYPKASTDRFSSTQLDEAIEDRQSKGFTNVRRIDKNSEDYPANFNSHIEALTSSGIEFETLEGELDVVVVSKESAEGLKANTAARVTKVLDQA